MIVGSGPTAPSAAGVLGYVAPRPQIDYPNGTIVYLNATSSASTTPPSSPTPSAPSAATPGSSAAPSTSYQFTVNRELWGEGPDILTLQQFLNAHGFQVATSGPGAPGQETDYFGMKTYNALVKFQSANGLPATGFFGPMTRAAIAGMSTTNAH